jgi:endonuclease-3
MTKSEKKKRLLMIDERLAALYPDAECALKFGGDGWRLLVMGRLSAQCTDARVNKVSEELFERYRTPEDMANADIDELSEVIRSCGLYRMKARNLIDSSRMLVEEFSGVIPNDIDALCRLPGVGRKIANLLVGDLYHAPAIVADTHFIRIMGRLGMYPESEKNPERIERIIRGLFPAERGSDLCHRVVLFGREICSARSPLCDRCPLSDICKRRERELSENGKI